MYNNKESGDKDSKDNRNFLNFFEAYVTMEEQKKKDREDLYNLINEARLLGITVSEREILWCNNSNFLKRVILDEIEFQKAKRKERLEKEEEGKRKVLKFWQEREMKKIVKEIMEGKRNPEEAIRYGYRYE